LLYNSDRQMWLASFSPHAADRRRLQLFAGARITSDKAYSFSGLLARPEVLPSSTGANTILSGLIVSALCKLRHSYIVTADALIFRFIVFLFLFETFAWLVR